VPEFSRRGSYDHNSRVPASLVVSPEDITLECEKELMAATPSHVAARF